MKIGASAAILTILYFSACNGGIPNTPAETPLPEETETAAIEAVREEFVNACRSADAAHLASLWTEDGILMSPGQTPASGRLAIQAAFLALFQAFEVRSFNVTNEEVEVAGDWAFGYGTARISLTSKSGSDPIDAEGRYLAVFKRQPAGGWKLHRTAVFSEMPPG